jgi:protein SCO1/2
MTTVCRALVAALVISTVVVPARAQYNGGTQPQSGLPADSVPFLLREVSLDQRLNEQIPLDLPFRDEGGNLVRFGDYLGEKPAVLVLVYFDCPMLCTQVLNDLVGVLKMLSLDAGKDFTVLAVSFNPHDRPEVAAAKKRAYVERYGRPQDAGGWHFLTGDDWAIRRLTAAVGFHYVFDKSIAQYAHPTGITILTPAGRLARYFYGVDYSPRDVRLALVEASAGKIGSPADRILLYCYHYDPTTGKYGFLILRAVRIGGVAMMITMGTFIFLMWRREKRPAAVHESR